ncbi:response regulator containing a CheY-like receiver domain and an HTH DNA-binding domain [Pseudomonas sp. GM78]|uniref:response regulator n=1 Tax=Pseudomonas sp. GM78 TaxID=1144337 RepID=UPI00026F73ED|nr:response regulator transcription factor [Pseudomonas sp. GM78]EJN34234.1 response regulator containing a CheY-like receiver domain and an HTH DNA-binding domain [Pseudomonas sp. GM78]
MTVRIVLVDDHNLVRAGIRVLLEDWGYSVVAEGCDGDDVERLLAQHKPDILLMDITMERLSGLEALTHLRVHWPALPVILLSMHDTRDFVLKAMQVGASAYLLKDAAEVELRMAIQAVLSGHRYLSPKISGRVIEAMTAPRAADPEEVTLTARQREVLYWLVNGKTNKEIAYQLNLSVKTVDAHRAQLMVRLNIRDLAGLVVYAIRQGILDLG